MNNKIIPLIIRIILLPIVVFLLLAPFLLYILPILPVIFVKVFTTLACIYLFLIFIIGVFFGRAYCYHICPITALFLCIAKITKNQGLLKQKYPKWLSEFFIAIWFIGFAYLAFQLSFSKHHESIYYLPSVIVLYSLLIIACILSLLLIRNPDNHPMCPLIPYLITGTMAAKGLRLPRLHVKAAPERCRSCKACNKVCLASLDVNKLVKEASLGTSQKCFNCGCCSHTCKYGAISYKFNKE